MAPKSLSKLFFGVLFLTSLVQYSCQTAEDGCPRIEVKKNRILRTKMSIKKGAKYLAKEVVGVAKECYNRCCARRDCNLGLLQYKNATDGGIERTCYLFDCGNPSKCSFAPYPHYAAIVFAPRGEDMAEGRDVIDDLITTTRRPTTTSLAEELNCPPGAPVAMCLADPCVKAVCPAYPSAECKANYCGGCFAHFFDKQGSRVSCKVEKPHFPANSKEELDLERTSKHEVLHHHNKPKPVKPVDLDKDELQKMQNFHSSKHSSHKSHSQNRIYDIDEVLPNKKSEKLHLSVADLEEKLDRISPHEKKPEEEAELDHDQRVWPDNNPNYPEPPHKITEEPLDHDQRQWLDNNPDTLHQKAKVTTVKVTPKPTIEKTTTTTTKPPKPKMKPTRKPAPPKPKTAQKLTPAPTALPVVVHNKGKNNEHIETAGRMNVTMVIEDNRVHFIENKAVLPLAIFLVIAILLLFVVALRLRIIKSKLKRRPFATEDADYLINGMYL